MWKEFPDGRLETEIIEASNTRFIVLCKLYKTEADSKPCSTGLALETISDRGVNANFALPNAETSAIGRALANAGFSAKGKRPSREEMASVNSKSETFTVEKTFYPSPTLNEITDAAFAYTKVLMVAREGVTYDILYAINKITASGSNTVIRTIINHFTTF